MVKKKLEKACIRAMSQGAEKQIKQKEMRMIIREYLSVSGVRFFLYFCRWPLATPLQLFPV